VSAAPSRARILKGVRAICQRLVSEHASRPDCAGASWDWETPRGHWCPAARVILSTWAGHRRIRVRVIRASNGEVAVVQEPIADVRVTSHGSLHLFVPATEAAADKLRALVQEDAQWLGRSLAVEPRYSSGLVSLLQSEGLEVSL
jgi:hypothetical protein